MRAGQAKPAVCNGFLTVVEHANHGLFGGYLLLNLSGRPLEFHCTAPVKPNRAQEILFGPTLAPFLYGEQIGRALLTRSECQPLVVFTDLPHVLAVREHVSLPVALVLPGESATGLAVANSETERASSLRGLEFFDLGSHRLGVHAADASCVRERLASADLAMDPWEPFGRIREAIEEAQRGAKVA